MSHAHGSYLGGIRSVECLRQRSRVDEETGCWVWGLGTSTAGAEMCIVLNGKSIRCRGRRAAVMLKTGAQLPRGHVAFAKNCCHTHTCVNPDHARSGSRVEHGKIMTSRGVMSTLSRISTAHRNGRAAGKLTMDEARDIRSSDEPVPVLAERYGVSGRTIREVRAGRRWRETPLLSSASVFAYAAAA